MDSLAYGLLLGRTDGIETEYKQIMHARREIPVSNCPSFIENMIYSTGGTTDAIDREESAVFKVMTDELDQRSEKYERSRAKKDPVESKHQKHNRLGIHDGEWCRVDTDGVFEFCGSKYLRSLPVEIP